jgi:branched-chain amino acid transport system permease protein
MMALFGLLFYAVVHLPLAKRQPTIIIIGTVMVGIVMQNAANLIWGSWPFRVESPFGDGNLTLFGSTIPVHTVATIAITALLIVGLYYLMQRTAVGRCMRAIAQDPSTASLMGLPVRAYLAFSWMLASILASCAGLLVAPMWFADVNMGEAVALKAFAATIIGGFGSIPGAVLGGLSVGLIEVLGAAYGSSAYKDLFAFAAMILFLIVRPQGIFGEPVSDRG